MTAALSEDVDFFIGPHYLPLPNSRPTLARAIDAYRVRVSILKKGFAQEVFRLQQLQRSSLGPLVLDDVTSVDIASYRDNRLAEFNLKTSKMCIRDRASRGRWRRASSQALSSIRLWTLAPLLRRWLLQRQPRGIKIFDWKQAAHGRAMR